MIRALASLLGIGCMLQGCVDTDGPRLERVEPVAAGRGAIVELIGRGLCDGDCATAGGEVQLGLSSEVVLATILEFADTRTVIEIPDIAPIGRTKIVITVNEQASNALDFEVVQ